VSFGEEDGEEFDQIKVALVPVVELDVPDEFGVSEHVVVSDHATVSPTAKLHPDVSSDEVVRVRGRGMRRRGVGGYLRPFPPHASEGISVVGNGGGESLSQWADSWGESTRGHLSGVPSYLPPRTLGVGSNVGEDGVVGGVVGGAGVHDGVGGAGHVERPSASGNGCGASLWDGVWGRARADRREESGGYTHCSRRYCRGNRRARVRVRVRGG
jgi:hypothetical protein